MLEIPQIGLGTWKLTGKDGQEVIEKALEMGYRHIDTADLYRNHREVGQAIKNSGIPREEIFLVTKIFPPLTAGRIQKAGPRFLEELQTDYVDLLLVHWPDLVPTANALENFQKLKEEGVTRHIGVSNFGLNRMKQSVSTGLEIYNNQLEIYPGNVDEELISYCKEEGISVTAYSPLAEGRILNDPRLRKLAEEKNATVAKVILKYLLLKGLIIIPKASSGQHLRENLEASKVELTLGEFEALGY